MDLETALRELHSQDFFIWDHFLSASEVGSVVADYQQIYNHGSFQRAGTGNKAGPRNINSDVRTDETYWLNPLDLTLSQSLFWNRLEELKKEINERFFLGLWSLEGHYSRYPINGYYHKHLDRFSNDDQRTVSMVLYFNSKWTASDGGELRLHLATPPKTIDVAPLGGRLVCFLSSKVLHEVLVANKERLSFAGWWKRRPKGGDHLLVMP